MARDRGDDAPTVEALERTLRVTGPLLRQRARVAPPDPAFVETLRARLLATGTAPDPASVRAVRSVRSRPPRATAGRVVGGSRRWRGALAGLALAVAVLAVLVVAAVALVWVDLVVVALVALVALALLVVVVGRRRR